MCRSIARFDQCTHAAPNCVNTSWKAAASLLHGRSQSDIQVNWSPNCNQMTHVKQAWWVTLTSVWILHDFQFHNSIHLHCALLCDAIKIYGFPAPSFYDGWLPEMCGFQNFGFILMRMPHHVCCRSRMRSIPVCRYWKSLIRSGFGVWCLQSCIHCEEF